MFDIFKLTSAYEFATVGIIFLRWSSHTSFYMYNADKANYFYVLNVIFLKNVFAVGKLDIGATE